MIENFLINFFNTYGAFLVIIFAFFYLIMADGSRLVIFFIAMAATVFFTSLIKELFLLPRPFFLNGNFPSAGLNSFSGFPSLHTSISFSASTFVFFVNQKFGIISFLVSLIFGIGRIYSNVHYPIDILIGAFLGIFVALFFENIRIKKRT